MVDAARTRELIAKYQEIGEELKQIYDRTFAENDEEVQDLRGDIRELRI